MICWPQGQCAAYTSNTDCRSEGILSSQLKRVWKDIWVCNVPQHLGLVWIFDSGCRVSKMGFNLSDIYLMTVSFLNLFFDWGKIALQCCVGFCHTTMQTSHNYTSIPSLLASFPTPHATPLAHHRSPGRMNTESSINTHTCPCVRQMAGEKLLWYTGGVAWQYLLNEVHYKLVNIYWVPMEETTEHAVLWGIIRHSLSLLASGFVHYLFTSGQNLGRSNWYLRVIIQDSGPNLLPTQRPSESSRGASQTHWLYFWSIIALNVMVVSAGQWSESAKHLHISPPSWISPPTPHPIPLGHPRAPSWVHSWPPNYKAPGSAHLNEEWGSEISV